MNGFSVSAGLVVGVLYVAIGTPAMADALPPAKKSAADICQSVSSEAWAIDRVNTVAHTALLYAATGIRSERPGVAEGTDEAGYPVIGTSSRSPQALEPDVANVVVCGYKPATFRATYNNGSSLPTGAYFQWYSRSGNTYTPVAYTTSSSTESTLVLPAPFTGGNLPSPVTYYVSIIDVNGAEGQRHATTATYYPIPILTVKADKLCPGTTAAVTMSVVGATPSTTSYYWYDQPNPQGTSPYPEGSTFSPTVSNARTYYVQAIPKSGTTGCASELTPVAIDYHQTIIPSQLLVPVAVVKGSPLLVSLDGAPGYTYTWDWRDPSSSATVLTSSGSGTLTTSHIYQTVGGYDIQLTIKDNNSPIPCYDTKKYHLEVGTDLCNTLLPAAGLSTMKVRRSNRNGSFVFIPATCPAINTAFGCVTGEADSQNMAVAATAVSLTELAPAADPAYALTQADLATNPFLAGAGRLRPEATYTYATPVINTHTYSTERGRFQVVPFNWQVSSTYHLPAWRRAGQATRYSPDGQALEEQDILHIPSAVKLGYQSHSLPYLTAKNAYYKQVLFEGFERPNALQGEDAFTVSASEARTDTLQSHSGNQCLKLMPAEGRSVYRLTLPTFNTLTGEVQLRLWLRISDNYTPGQALDKSKTGHTTAAPTLRVNWGNNLETPMTIIAQTGEWLLCEASVNLGASGAASGVVSPVFFYSAPSQQQAWVDDVRLQPLAAQMSCYVYDWKTLKLLASFDDQHFGLYYQYNAEGKLVRKQVETERGLMTIQETQYNLPRP